MTRNLFVVFGGSNGYALLKEGSPILTAQIIVQISSRFKLSVQKHSFEKITCIDFT